jgi:hypothetical protein
LVALPAAFFAVIALLPRQKLNFSEAHKTEIASIALHICSSSGVEPCPLQLGGKNKWFGTLPTQGFLSVTSIDDLRKALPAPAWSSTDSPQEYELTNGTYVVTYIKASGAIVITSAN